MRNNQLPSYPVIHDYSLNPQITLERAVSDSGLVTVDALKIAIDAGEDPGTSDPHVALLHREGYYWVCDSIERVPHETPIDALLDYAEQCEQLAILTSLHYTDYVILDAAEIETRHGDISLAEAVTEIKAHATHLIAMYNGAAGQARADADALTRSAAV